MLAQDDEWPHRGYAPTTLWLPGERVLDQYEVTVPPAVAPGRHGLSLGLYRRADQRRLAVVGPGIQGDQLALGWVKVEPRPALAADRLPAPGRIDALLGGQAKLLAGDLRLAGETDAAPATYRPGGRLALTLYWQAAMPLSADYTVFVHLDDAAGALRAQSDGSPADGNYPTSLWEPGEVVVDRRTLELPPDLPPGSYRLTVGLYSLENGARLTLPSGADQVELRPVVVE
jgi:hypothetical protein